MGELNENLKGYSMATFKRMIKNTLPFGLVELLKGRNKIWSGDFSSWSEAKAVCKGYDDKAIIEKVHASALQVRSGNKKYERDSVVFDEIEYSWPVSSCFLFVALAESKKLNILDFGGGLGSCYFQHAPFFTELEHLSWSIVEQEAFYEIGIKDFCDERLKFYPDINTCFNEENVNVVFLSSVLQYLDSPYEILGEILEKNSKYIILDRLSIINRDKDRITTQVVPKEIYEATYPCRFFSKTKLMSVLLEKYEVVFEFDSYIKNEVDFPDGEFSSDKGFLLRRKI